MSDKKASSKRVGLTDDDFMRKYDKSFLIPQAIEAGLQSLGDGWLTNDKFAAHCGVSIAALATYRSKYEDHIVYVEGTKATWWGNRARAAKWRAKLKGLVS